MPKKTKQQTPRFWQSPQGYFVSAAVLLIAGYILGSLAIDSGSVAQWLGTIVALVWGFMRLIQGTKQLFFTKTHGKKR